MNRERSINRQVAVLGIVAIVVAGLIGYVSYNALNGLPFQDRYEIKIELPDAQRLIANSDVRIGGVRVGQVKDVQAQPSHGVAAGHALVKVALEPSVGPVPLDTSASVRAASALGATYVQLTLGRSRETLSEHGTLPLKQNRETVSVTDLFEVFRGASARNFQDSISGAAQAFAGRGEALNATIGSTTALLGPFTRVAAAVADRRAHLGDFLDALSTTSGLLAADRQPLAHAVAGAATTADAIARERVALGRAIRVLPPTESAATRAFTDVRPGLRSLARLMTALRPGADLLPKGLKTVNGALASGQRPFRALPGLMAPARATLRALQSFSGLQSTNGALRKLTELMTAGQRVVDVVLPAQVHCNVIGLFGQNISSAFGAMGTGHGPTAGVFGLGTLGASTDEIQAKELAHNAHLNYAPREDSTECESNNEPYDANARGLGSPAGAQRGYTRKTTPPAGVLQRADAVGLLAREPGAR